MRRSSRLVKRYLIQTRDRIFIKIMDSCLSLKIKAKILVKI